METTLYERTLTELDHVRISHLLQRDHRGAAAAPQMRLIEAALDVATVVPSRQVPADVVTMYSQVEVEDIDTGQRSLLTPCYPADAAPATGRVSVLSPVGWALLGLRAGEVARWHTPAGESRVLRVRAIPFQPEASGDYTT